MQALYQSETAGTTPEEAFQLLKDNFQANKKAASYACELLKGVTDNLEEIDSHIREHSQHWRLERMARVDRNILRVAVYELCERPDVPATVVINEALEVAARYSDEDSSPFINGVLDSLKNKLGRE